MGNVQAHHRKSDFMQEDQNTKNIKNAFHTAFMDENLLEITFECLGKMVESGQGSHRLYQKFLDSLNPFLSYKWN